MTMNNKPKNHQNRILTIPNMMSFFRIALIPLFVWLYVHEHNAPATALVLVLSGVTDLADGYIARHFNMVSDFGKALDPVADKLTQSAMLLCLFTKFPLMLMVFLLMALKETFAAITSFLVIRKTGQVNSANWHGKINTCLLYGMMIIHIIWPTIPVTVSNGLIFLCVVMMVISAILYGVTHLRALCQKPC